MVNDYTLTVVDTIGIQNYVFGTNNLQQITGASYLVNCATRQWVEDSLSGMKHNKVDFDDVYHPFGSECIEKDGLDAELIYAGGGNTVLIFSDKDKAIFFTRTLTKKILAEAPGLSVVIVHEPFQWDKPIGGENGVLQKAMKSLAEQKTQGDKNIPLLGRAITAECVFTSLPAVGVDEDNRLVSAESSAKFHNRKTAFMGMLGQIDLKGFQKPPYEFDQLGMTYGEKSMLAVIHIDGNGMGKRIENLSKPYTQGGDLNREFLNTMRAFSVSIQAAVHEAMQAVVNHLDHLMTDTNTDTDIAKLVQIPEGRLPFRPIVFGGDDITLVCDGRLGLGLAAFYLKELNSKKLADKKNLVCRAGVAIVNAHFPFARAYSLAEELCDSAKKEIQTIHNKLEQTGETADISAIDWHVATSGLLLGLEDIRQREYQVGKAMLYARPLYLQITPAEAVGKIDSQERWRSWDNFLVAVKEFKYGESWLDHRNKVKALREVMRNGPDATRQFSVLYNPHWPQLSGITATPQKAGWLGDRCLYFDAIEMIDLFNELK